MNKYYKLLDGVFLLLSVFGLSAKEVVAMTPMDLTRLRLCRVQESVSIGD